ncbi:MAG: hypothetical protein M3015_04350 [Bacteroidota bacterium]|nr:hypothetical protein [Bacteroidota bacterium]
MIKEENNIDFYTTGRKPSEKEFERISELIKKEKEKKGLSKLTLVQKGKVRRPEKV